MSCLRYHYREIITIQLHDLTITFFTCSIDEHTKILKIDFSTHKTNV